MDIYEHYSDELVIDNQFAHWKSDIFRVVGEKLGKTQKAAYMLLKRVHDKKNEDAEQDYIATDRVENVVDPIRTTLKKSAASKMDEAANPKSDAIHSYSGQFSNNGIFEIECRNYKHRKGIITKKCVQSGWTSKLTTLLFKETDLSCKFDSKRAWIVSDGTIHTKGMCDCGSILDVSSDLTLLHVNVTKIRKDYSHSRKYQMRGEMKQKLSGMLKNKNAHPVQVKFVNEVNPYNEELSERFDTLTPSLQALRQLRYRQEKTGKDPFAEILNMKDSDYADVISFVSHSPFAIFYQTPLQLALYIAESKKGDISLSIDATGSLIIPLKLSQKIIGTNKLKHVFLYQIMLKTTYGKSVPIAQMLSQDHTSEFIELFLRKIFKQMKPPTEIVSDESKALLKALAATFAGCDSVDGYVEKCMDSLLTGAPKPSIQLRIDRSHFVKNITNKIKDRDHRRRNFFRGVIGYLIQCDYFGVAKQIIEDFFTVILNEYDGSDDIGMLPSEISKRKLLHLLATYDKDTDYDEDDIKPDDTELDVGEKCLWIEEIISKVVINREMPKEQHGNLYYSPKEKNFYTKIFSTIPLWSNVMNNLFATSKTVATSSDVESNFKTLKTGIIGRRMISPHIFLKIHIDFVNAEVKLNAGSKKRDSAIATIRKRSNSFSEISPTVHRKRSNSNQFEYKGYEASEPEIGNHHTISRLYYLVNRLFFVLRKHESAFLFHLLFYCTYEKDVFDPSRHTLTCINNV